MGKSEKREITVAALVPCELKEGIERMLDQGHLPRGLKKRDLIGAAIYAAVIADPLIQRQMVITYLSANLGEGLAMPEPTDKLQGDGHDVENVEKAKKPIPEKQPKLHDGHGRPAKDSAPPPTQPHN